MQDRTKQNEHEAVAELLPWLINDRLSENETGRVKAHLEHCEECQAIAEQLKSVEHYLSAEKTVWKPSRQHFSALWSEVEKLENAASQPGKKKDKSPRPTFFSEYFKNLKQTPSPMRWTLALESVALVALLTVWGTAPHHLTRTTPDPFRTLSDESQPAVKTPQSQLRLLLDDTMTAAALTKLLQQHDAQISQGPSELGFYTLKVAPDHVQSVLQAFRQHPHVRLIQPMESQP